MKFSLLFLCVLLSFGSIRAQGFQFGIGLEASAASLNTENNLTGTPFTSFSASGGAGFGLSILGRYAFSDNLALSLQPGILFQSQELGFGLSGDPEVEEIENLYATSVVVPLRFEYTFGQATWRPLIGAGIGYQLNLKDDDATVLEQTSGVGLFDATVGVEGNFAKFNIRPELFYRSTMGPLAEALAKNPFNKASGNVTAGYLGFRLVFYK